MCWGYRARWYLTLSFTTTSSLTILKPRLPRCASPSLTPRHVGPHSTTRRAGVVLGDQPSQEVSKIAGVRTPLSAQPPRCGTFGTPQSRTISSHCNIYKAIRQIIFNYPMHLDRVNFNHLFLFKQIHKTNNAKSVPWSWNTELLSPCS